MSSLNFSLLSILLLGSTAAINDVAIAIHLIETSPLHQLFLVPAPDAITKTIPNFEPGIVTVDTNNLEYLDESYTLDLIHINDSMAITRKPINSKKILSESSLCQIRSIFTKSNQCELVKLDDNIDKWIDTPIIDMIAFVSTVEKTIDCDGGKAQTTDQDSRFSQTTCELYNYYENSTHPRA